MTTQEAIETIKNHHAVEEVTVLGKAETSTAGDYYRIRLKDGSKFYDGTNSLFVAEEKLKKIATLVAV